MLPWIDKKKASDIREKFKLLPYEELKIQEEKRQAVGPTADSKPAPTEAVKDKEKTGGKVSSEDFPKGSISSLAP